MSSRRLEAGKIRGRLEDALGRVRGFVTTERQEGEGGETGNIVWVESVDGDFDPVSGDNPGGARIGEMPVDLRYSVEIRTAFSIPEGERAGMNEAIDDRIALLEDAIREGCRVLQDEDRLINRWILTGQKVDFGVGGNPWRHESNFNLALSRR